MPSERVNTVKKHQVLEHRKRSPWEKSFSGMFTFNSAENLAPSAYYCLALAIIRAHDYASKDSDLPFDRSSL